MTGASNKALEVILDLVPCIYYLVQFEKDKATVQALIDSSSKVNAITPAHAKQLDLQTQKTDVKAQKIERSSLNMFGMVIAGF